MHYCSDVSEISTKSKVGTVGHPEKSSWDTGTFLLRMGQMGTLVFLPMLLQHEQNTACEVMLRSLKA
jgi:hypothetical protein